MNPLNLQIQLKIRQKTTNLLGMWSPVFVTIATIIIVFILQNISITHAASSLPFRPRPFLNSSIASGIAFEKNNKITYQFKSYIDSFSQIEFTVLYHPVDSKGQVKYSYESVISDYKNNVRTGYIQSDEAKPIQCFQSRGAFDVNIFEKDAYDEAKFEYYTTVNGEIVAKISNVEVQTQRDPELYTVYISPSSLNIVKVEGKSFDYTYNTYEQRVPNPTVFQVPNGLNCRPDL